RHAAEKHHGKTEASQQRSPVQRERRAVHIAGAHASILRLDRMKTALLLIGCIAVLVGLLWIGQGTGFVRWPASSFMIDERQWAWYGLALATVGGGLIAHSRQRSI